MGARLHRTAVAIGLATAVVAITTGSRSSLGAAGHTPGDHRRCRECHDGPAFAPGQSHPVDVHPTTPVRGHLPLLDGRVTCLTCHDLESPSTALLRTAGDGGDLCVHCHTSARTTGAAIHALATRQAHPASDAASSRVIDHARGFDEESARCLACHDGAVAFGMPFESGPRDPLGVETGVRAAARLLGAQHAIGAEQRPRGIGDNLVMPHRLDERIRLFDGRIGCGSCHSLYARNEDLLVIPNDRSDLCLGCHDL